MLQQELQSLTNSNPTQSANACRARTRYRLLGIVAALAVLLTCAVYITSESPLTEAERDIVGKWAMSIGPNPPPSNAVRQVYEFAEGHRFMFHGIPMQDKSAATMMIGTWRIEDGELIVHAVGNTKGSTADSILNKFSSNGPKPPVMQSRYRLLGRTENALRVKEQAVEFDLERYED